MFATWSRLSATRTVTSSLPDRRDQVKNRWNTVILLLLNNLNFYVLDWKGTSVYSYLRHLLLVTNLVACSLFLPLLSDCSADVGYAKCACPADVCILNIGEWFGWAGCFSLMPNVSMFAFKSVLGSLPNTRGDPTCRPLVYLTRKLKS